MSQQFSIYLHTNKVNGKRYVGQTTKTVAGRWAEHVAAAKQHLGAPALGAAIRKYGADAFTHELLDVVTSQKGADIAERVWIEQRFSRAPDGYNLSSGGLGVGRHHEDTKRLMRARKLSLAPEHRKANATKASMAALVAREQNGPPRYVPRGTKECTRIVKKAWETRRSQGFKVAPESREKAWETRRSRYGESGTKLTPANITHEQSRARTLKSWETRRAKYGKLGVKQPKTFEQHSERTRKAAETKRLNRIK